MSTAQPSLKLEDLHPVLQMIYNIGCEVEYSLASHIRKDGGGGRTALDLTDGKEENRGKIDHYSEHIISGRILAKIPVYAEEYRWRVHFAVENDGKLEEGLSVVLDGVHNEAQGLKQLKVIAQDLQRAYALGYTPRLFRDGSLVQQILC